LKTSLNEAFFTVRVWIFPLRIILIDRKPCISCFHVGWRSTVDRIMSGLNLRKSTLSKGLDEMHLSDFAGESATAYLA
jgi:hypothetical protein